MRRFLAVGFAVLTLALSVIILDAPAKFSRPLLSIPNTVTHSLTKLKSSFFEAYDAAQSPDVSLVGVSNHHVRTVVAHKSVSSNSINSKLAAATPKVLATTTSTADLTEVQALVNQTFQSYLAAGKLTGAQGAQGPQGIQGIQGPPGSAGSIQTFGSGGNSNDTSGTILGVTELSARDLTVSNNTSVNNLTVSGSLNGNSLSLANALTVSNGGTGVNMLIPNGILFGNGTSAIGTTSAGTTGQCLQSNGGSAAPSWGTCTLGTGRWDQLQAPTSDLGLSMGSNSTTLTFGNTTGSSNLFTLTDSASNTGTGYLLNVATTTGSSLKPLQVVAAGTTAFTIDSTGLVTANNLSLTSPLTIGNGGTGSNTATGATSNLQFLQIGTGAVARSLATKVGETVSVKDFGAVGNGITDDTAAIQAAIASSAASIIFPPGTYSVTAGTSYNVTGKNIYATGATILRARFAAYSSLNWVGGILDQNSDTSSSPMFGASGSNIYINGLTITYTHAYTGVQVGYNPTDVRLSNMVINDAGESVITILSGQKITIDNLHMTASSSGAVDDGIAIMATQGPTSDVLITGCTATYNYDIVKIINNSLTNAIRNISVSNCAANHVKVPIYMENDGPVENVTIDNITDNDPDGTYMQNGILIAPGTGNANPGGVLTNLHISNFVMRGRFTSSNQHQMIRIINNQGTISGLYVTDSVFDDLYNGVANDINHPGYPADEWLYYQTVTSGTAQNWQFKNVTVNGTSSIGVQLSAPVTDMSITDSKFSNIYTSNSTGYLIYVVSPVDLRGTIFTDLSPNKKYLLNGTTSAGSLYTLTGNDPSTGIGDSSIGLVLQNAAGNNGQASLDFYGLGGSSGKQWRYASIDGLVTSENGSIGDVGALLFATKTNQADTALTERMRITGSGNVGIGSTSPSALLSVGASNQFQVSSIGDTTANSLTLTNALTVANGGTGDQTLAADGILYGNGVSAVGVTSVGTAGQCLQSNGAGNAPTFGACGISSLRWDQLLNPNTNLALSMGSDTTTLTFGNATGSSNLFNLTDTASNTGTGYLLNLTTQASSTLKPLQVVAAGATALTINAAGLVTANNFGSSSAAITGGSINGTIIGATTAAAGTFTTVTGNTSINSSTYNSTGLTTFTSGSSLYLNSNSLTGQSGTLLQNGGTTRWQFAGSGNAYALVTGADNSYDIGDSYSFRPRNIYAASGALIPQLYGGTSVASVPNVSTPTITNQGTAGSTTWAYKIVGVDGNGNVTAASAAGQTTTGNATLDSTNYNTITWTPVKGAVTYRVYRTTSGGTPSTTGLIASGIANFSYNDQGAAGDSSTPPTSNNTGLFGIGTSSPASKLDIIPTDTFGAAGVSGINSEAHTVTLSGTNPTTYPTFYGNSLGAMTLTGTNAGQTVTTASSLYVATPVAGTNVTVTNNYPISTQTGAYLSSGGTWTNASDRNLKENFTPVDPADILNKINMLPVTEWDYKTEGPVVKHIGPVAQDFYAVFGLGNNNTSISTIDPAGIALLGIQALSKQIQNIQGSLGENLSSDGSLTVTQPETLQSTLTVLKQVTFSGDTVGEAEIKTGVTSVRIAFSEQYQYQPIVTITPKDQAVLAFVTDDDATGFTIKIATPISSDVTFYWHAFGAEGAKLTVSDGTSQDITLVVPPSSSAAGTSGSGTVNAELASGSAQSSASSSANGKQIDSAGTATPVSSPDTTTSSNLDSASITTSTQLGATSSSGTDNAAQPGSSEPVTASGSDAPTSSATAASPQGQAVNAVQ